MSKSKYEKVNLNQGCAQGQLLAALRRDDLSAFQKILAGGGVDADHYYGYPDYNTCLGVACAEPGHSQFVRLLLDHSADVNRASNQKRKAPLHYAAEAGDIETIKTLVDCRNIQINALTESNTAIHLAIKRLDDLDKSDTAGVRRFEDVIECLLRAKINVNIADSKGLTPIHSAALFGMERIVTLIINHAAMPLSLDWYKDDDDDTARMAIENELPDLLPMLPAEGDTDETMDIYKLIYLINSHEEDDFKNAIKEMKKDDLKKIFTEDDGSYTLLQLSCDKGLDKIVSTLLKNDADPNFAVSGSMRPIALACYGGYHEVLAELVRNNHTTFEASNGESLFQIVIRKGETNLRDSGGVDYAKCFKILIDTSKTDAHINYQDMKKNTALHYATRGKNQDIVTDLLKKGAYVGLHNRFNDPPLADMKPRTLEAYLDGCLTANKERPYADEYEIIFDYKFLVPPTDAPGSECKVAVTDDSDDTESSNDRFLAREIDPLLYMTQHSELRPLLKHPVITSFLFLKWQRISCLFYANTAFYTLFWLSLILYILLGYGGPQEKSDLTFLVAKVTQVFTVVGLLMLIMREFFQMVVSPRVYFKSIQNWLEICLIIVTSIIMFNITENEKYKQQLSAIAILLSSTEFVLLIGQFPALTTNIVMLKTVSWNFFKFLLWYCILIIAFSLSFYTLFRGDGEKSTNGGSKSDENITTEAPSSEEETDFFLNPGISLFKTIVMLTGELDASSINFEAFPVTSHIIFLVFVIMIPIVLFNLLNGLAVSDTQAIKENAELVGHISRIQMISYLECVLLNDTVPYKNIISCLRKVCCRFPDIINIKYRLLICLKPLARRISLFPNFLPVAKVGVKINKHSKVIIYTSDNIKKGRNEESNDDSEISLCCLRTCNEMRMENKIVKAAKTLILEKLDDEKNELRNRLDNIEKILKDIVGSLKNK